MKKFIAAFDSLNFNESTLRYAIFLARHSHAFLVGVFLEDYTRRSYGFREIAAFTEGDKDSYVRRMDVKDEEARKESIETFERACQLAG
ncbi:MAG TPA: universal stress protein, partial [Flavisolibacter sp.]|nr:universal stress protein [Flavisolibacter sp.]